jgi:hypothetical protein
VLVDDAVPLRVFAGIVEDAAEHILMVRERLINPQGHRDTALVAHMAPRLAAGDPVFGVMRSRRKTGTLEK